MSDRVYCYPGTDTLKNKLGIIDEQELFDTEREITAARIAELQIEPIQGGFDFDHLKRIHAHLFQDIYEWAGKPRTVNIGKGNIFCLVEYIDSYAEDVFCDFASSCRAASSAEELAPVLADRFADLNALHPFREGNGRTQREFARELCLDCGFALDFGVTDKDEMLRASIASFNGDNAMLAEVFAKAIVPLSDIDAHLARILDNPVQAKINAYIAANDTGGETRPDTPGIWKP